jgi:Lhr-like helicase
MNIMRLSAVRSAGLLFGIALLSACASGSAPRTGVSASVAPAMTIERFLAAANQNDIDTMAALFGTRDGSVTRTWSRKEVDERMLVFANLLRHTDYTIASEQLVAGRREEATQLNVRMVIRGDTLQVPFILVRTSDQNWLIEDIGIETVTRGSRNGQ